MRITDITASPVDVRYKPAWQHDKRFYIKTDTQTNVIVRIHTDEGITGIGEAAHSPGVFGETAQATLGAIELFTPHLTDQDPRRITKLNMIMDRLSPVGNIAAKAALDIALHDITAKSLEVPVYQILGGRVHERLKTHINPATSDNAKDDVLAFVNEGYRVFKLKMSGDRDYDLEMVRRILHVIDSDVLLSLDANQGWSVNETIQVAEVIERDSNYKQNVILEQPILASDVRGLARIRNSTKLLVMADDGLRTVKDLWEVIEREAADIVSLKISRVGGFQRTQQMIALAESVNLPYIVDEINEMRVANTAVAHLALASKNPLYTGVTCHLLLEEDIVDKGGVIVEDGYAKLPDTPGLGIKALSLSLAG